MELTQEELIKRKIQINKRKFIADIILIIVILIIAGYIINNIESFKAVGQDVCKLCQLKTNSICYSKP